MTEHAFQDMLVALRDRAHCTVTGSWARGHQNEDSDIDLVCPSHEMADKDAGRPEAIKTAIAIFDEFNVAWGSCVMGSISSEDNRMPRMVEVHEACWMEPEKTENQNVEVHGVRFRVYRRIEGV